MDFFAIRALRENHPGWSLLRADTAPLALSFFMAAFTVPNRRNLGRQELIDTLDDVLFRVHESLGESSFPKPAAEYLDDWAHPEKAWLRKYYADGRDEPVYDLTAATEDVVRWIEALEGREFVATQSRLTGIFALLKRLVQGSETDPEVRLTELRAERDRIDAEIERVANGDIRVMSSSEALDHFDEAFGRGSDESARYGLELFRRMRLQLLIVTPLQKIHVIEPYVSHVGFVANPSGQDSRLRNMTIQEYREERERRAG